MTQQPASSAGRLRWRLIVFTVTGGVVGWMVALFLFLTGYRDESQKTFYLLAGLVQLLFVKRGLRLSALSGPDFRVGCSQNRTTPCGVRAPVQYLTRKSGCDEPLSFVRILPLALAAMLALFLADVLVPAPSGRKIDRVAEAFDFSTEISPFGFARVPYILVGSTLAFLIGGWVLAGRIGCVRSAIEDERPAQDDPAAATGAK